MCGYLVFSSEFFLFLLFCFWLGSLGFFCFVGFRIFGLFGGCRFCRVVRGVLKCLFFGFFWCCVFFLGFLLLFDCGLF